MLTQKIESALTKRKDKRRQMVLEEDPFSLEIVAVPLPKGFKQPMIESYDGVTDPLDHLRMFVDMMRLYAAPDAVMCRSFPPTLRREARDWVATLAPQSVKTFDQLSQSFVVYFLSSKRKRKDRHRSNASHSRKRGNSTRLSRPFQQSHVGNQRPSNVSCSDCHNEWNPESMQELLRKWDKYVDAEETEGVTKSLHEGREPETNKRKSHNNQHVRDDKGK
ncbi:Uncharacterized protein Adt_03703 [Abeliophyllum distichum]|uniref:Retrotransposon gag domain-containing protein n=1 Tax=Abeliophyllum distichum TaxID=126358 RepID=A0ABD1VZN7_9LAMI